MTHIVKSKRYRLYGGDNLVSLSLLADSSVDSVVCDPPYGLGKEPDPYALIQSWSTSDSYSHKSKKGFMGSTWDAFVPQPALWKEVFRVLKPGGYLVAFFGTRTYDLGTLAIRLSGFEIRDQLSWVYGSGFPKSLDVAKAIDGLIKHGRSDSVGLKKANASRPGLGRSRSSTNLNGILGKKASSKVTKDTPATIYAEEWSGWGTALKPAFEPIVLARKPLSEPTVAKNVLKHKTAGLNIDACRTPLNGDYKCKPNGRPSQTGLPDGYDKANANRPDTVGRWPANFIHDGSPDVLQCFPTTTSGTGAVKKSSSKGNTSSNSIGKESRVAGTEMISYGDTGSASRFFYCAKVSSKERNLGLSARNSHPTVKPVALMRWLCRLVTRPNGIILDPFLGSGSTGVAAIQEGFRFIGMEKQKSYFKIAEGRLSYTASNSRATIPVDVPKSKKLFNI